MPYNERMAERVRQALQARRGFAEKKMFGGVGFLLRGNMCVGVWREFLILRLGREQAEEALREPFVKPFDITGRAMSGWVMVERRGAQDDAALADWVGHALSFVQTLPAK
jgi:hypothetical protein